MRFFRTIRDQVEGELGPIIYRIRSFEKAVLACIRSSKIAGILWAEIAAIVHYCYPKVIYSSFGSKDYDLIPVTAHPRKNPNQIIFALRSLVSHTFPPFEDSIVLLPESKQLENILQFLHEGFGKYCIQAINLGRLEQGEPSHAHIVAKVNI